MTAATATRECRSAATLSDITLGIVGDSYGCIIRLKLIGVMSEYVTIKLEIVLIKNRTNQILPKLVVRVKSHIFRYLLIPLELDGNLNCFVPFMATLAFCSLL